MTPIDGASFGENSYPFRRLPHPGQDAGSIVRATNLLSYCFGQNRLAVLRLQIPVGKAQDLKTAGITDDPEIQLVPFVHRCPARQQQS